MLDLESLRFLAGLALLLGGAEALVRGASRIAAALRISPLVIGLTVVAFGTSSPELAASLTSARAGSGDLALGNVVGSNIFNLLVILGLAALVSPLTVQRKLVRLDLPIMLAVAVALFAVSADGKIDRREGIIFMVTLIVYLGFLFWEARREGVATTEAIPGEASPAPQRLGLAAVTALVGLGMLTLGAGWLVEGATSMARAFGISELVIGLTLVAAGTSLPEVATSVWASIRGQRDLAVGNVVGSNIFNVLAVLGVTAAVSPGGVPVAASARSFDLPILLAVSLACLPVFFSDLRIDRWEGTLFILVYVAYAAQLYSASQGSGSPSPVWLVATILGAVAIVYAAQVSSKRTRAGS